MDPALHSVADVVISVSPLAPANVRSVELTHWPLAWLEWETSGALAVTFPDTHQELYHPVWAFIAVNDRQGPRDVAPIHRFQPTDPDFATSIRHLANVIQGLQAAEAVQASGRPPLSVDQVVAMAVERVLARLGPIAPAQPGPAPAPSAFPDPAQMGNDLFELLIGVPGIGPSLASRMLANGGVRMVLLSIACADRSYLSRIPGVGPKVTELLVEELQETCAGVARHYGLMPAAPPSPAAEAEPPPIPPDPVALSRFRSGLKDYDPDFPL